MGDDASPPEAWQELGAIADALQDQLIVLPPDADGRDPASSVAADLDAWDELRAIAGPAASEPSAPPQRR